jgi:hypothetical protein
MFASTRKVLMFAIASLVLASTAARAQDGGVKISSPTNHQVLKAGSKVPVSGTVSVAGAVSVIVDPA